MIYNLLRPGDPPSAGAHGPPHTTPTASTRGPTGRKTTANA